MKKSLTILIFVYHFIFSSVVQANTDKSLLNEGIIEKTAALANDGDSNAQNNLGVYYLNGYGFKQNYQEAKKWFQLAADQGNSNAQVNLGLLYKNGEGVQQSYQEAKKWFQFAADQGNSDAQILLGFLYANGNGVQQSDQEAKKWLGIACDNGERFACIHYNELKQKTD